ncbi:MAG TPA: site-specific integrase [Prolixibacteraceae bacterium]|nr:site-specific integrase [Prolixibacteraceae bacterium]
MAAKYYSFRIDRSEGKILKDGSHPIVLVIRKEGQRKKLYLGISASYYINANKEICSQWNEEFQRYSTDGRKKDLHPDREKNNNWLNEVSVRCDAIINEFEKNRIDWTLNQFEQALLNKSKKTGIEAYFLQFIETLDKAGKFGNKKCYESTLYMLKKNDRDFEKRVFNEIDLKYVKRFSDYLDERGQSGNTKKYYIKTLRSIMNKAIKDGECSAVSYPFGKDGYSIAALAQETEKRYLPNEYIEKMKIAELKTYPLNWSRNLFLFSYFAQGMSVVDMAALRTKNIIVGEGESRYIVYRRQKTEGKKTRFIRIKITENLQNLLDWAKKDQTRVNDYLLPIVSIDGYEGQKLYTHIRDRYKRFNKHLKSLGTELKFEGIRLSSYQSRHSYAMRLKNSGIAEDVISEALGHKDLLTTKTYLDSFQNNEIDKANEVL